MSVPFRRMLAVALAGVVLGACSNAAEDATAPSTSDAALGPESVLYFTVSNPSVFFNIFEGAFTQTTQTVDVSGRIVTTTPYVRVLSVTYSPSNVKNWLTITQRPTLLHDNTLGVRMTFTVRVVPGLDQGASATVPITVPGARNGPQTITISIGDLNCPVSGNLAYPSQNLLVGNLQITDCLYALQGYETPPNLTPFDLYTLQVPASATFTVMLRGRPSNGGTNHDPYVYLWDPIQHLAVAQNDDGGGGFLPPLYDSRVVFTNPSTAPKLYYVLSSRCCGGNGPGNYGTYSIDIYNGVFTPSYTSPAALSGGASEPVLNSAEAVRNYVRGKQQRAQQKQ